MPVSGHVEERVKIPQGVKVELRQGELVVSKGNVSLSRRLRHPRVEVRVADGAVEVSCALPRRREKALVGTFASHVRNMIEGVTKGYTYRMKVVFSHFPMKVGVKGNEVVIENFLGEKFPRRAAIRGRAKVDVKGDQVLVTGSSLEDVSQTAANIEQATVIRNKDPRVFQDGVYITAKGVD